MSKIAVATDTNSGITPEEAEKEGIYLVPMPFSINGKEFFEGVNCTYEQFFEELKNGAEVKSSQPSPEAVTSLWDKLLKEYDEVVYIPMSAGLSGALSTAKALSMDYEGKVEVVDNKRISLSQKISVLDAKLLASRGNSAAEIREILEKNSYNASIYIAVNTLELLKKSGRVTAAGAAVASILGIKPVLQIQGDKLDAFSKARGMANAQKIMLDAIEKDRTERFAGRTYRIETAYSGDIGPAKEWLEMVKARFPGYDVTLSKLPISISCHTGAGALGTAVIEYID